MRIAWNKTHIQVAHLLGQASHESANFTRLVENIILHKEWLIHGQQDLLVNSKAKIKEPNALALSLHRNSEAIANNVYAIEWVMDQLKVVMVHYTEDTEFS
jgi:predicted chitinase